MRNIQKYIEHTNLQPTITSNNIELLLKEAKENKIFGICVPPFWVKKAKRDIGESDIQLITVIGFPLGYQMSQSKEAEAIQAIKDGADELDMVLNISAVKSEMMWPKIEIAKMGKLAHESGKILKVIIETAYLTDSEIENACKICADAGADFVKTSTGFAPSGAKVEHIKLMRSVLPDHVGIKASGGIKNHAQAVELIAAGADRIGTSSGPEICKSI
ncbi:2-deoxyribose-5-phosphate aldolase [Marivirga tractuosa]|uniref:Deoxyribose-phosphate aldolase n=1 Tax=Marivirga tractuosa (strain ATCC 23168 / DSM 4126 / NBRC 15989 / NCIMB 1408 / VKM B-1430 / H-43) TaxID=643867 RepID=E4TMX4_MARTH|nr:deoxyribose-phosphate aldolase [Marivirga tractuosa]ADR21405.1 deoxyribose-phosphate aldolase [Marivirga tractuosa DSM 4126]BDD14141.1 2-deoxyribose-5-phosphate aldolase [Marivirga tractuosa]